MTPPYQVTVTVDGDRFGATSALVALETSKDHSQMPEIGSLKTTVQIWIDLGDSTNMPYTLLSKLFRLANVVVADKIKPIKIELWRDGRQEDLLCAYDFNGWISKFETSAPLPQSDKRPSRDPATGPAAGSLLLLHVEPVMNQPDLGGISLSK